MYSEIDDNENTALIPKSKPAKSTFFCPKYGERTPFLVPGRVVAGLVWAASFGVFLSSTFYECKPWLQNSTSSQDNDCGLGTSQFDTLFYISVGLSLLSILINVIEGLVHRNDLRKFEFAVLAFYCLCALAFGIGAIVYNNKLENLPDDPITESSSMMISNLVNSGSEDVSLEQEWKSKRDSWLALSVVFLSGVAFLECFGALIADAKLDYPSNRY